MASLTDAGKSLITVGLSLLIFLTLLGNSIVLFVLLCRTRRLLHKPLYVFICNICVADILAILFTMTFEVSEELTHEWQFGEPACKVIEYLEMTFFGVNIFTHLSIAFERYRNVVRPLKPPMKLKIAKILISVSWAIPSVLSLPYLYTLRLVENDEKFTCTIVAMPWTWLDKLYLSIELLAIFLVPLISMVCMYIIVVHKLYHRKRQANAVLPQPTQTTMRAAAVYGSRVSIVVATVFVLCWLPFVLVYLIRLVTGTESITRKHTLYVIALYSSYVSELLTPLLYCAFDRNIKPALIDTLRCRLRTVTPGDDSASDINAPRSRAGTWIRTNESRTASGPNEE